MILLPESGIQATNHWNKTKEDNLSCKPNDNAIVATIYVLYNRNYIYKAATTVDRRRNSWKPTSSRILEHISVKTGQVDRKHK